VAVEPISWSPRSSGGEIIAKARPGGKSSNTLKALPRNASWGSLVL
jgi:hypothetical protein